MNRVIEYALENQSIDFSVGDMAEDLSISKPKAYETIRYYEEKDYIKKTRVIGKTQLYSLNKDSMRVKLLIKTFNECLKIALYEKAGNNRKYLKAKR